VLLDSKIEITVENTGFTTWLLGQKNKHKNGKKREKMMII